MTTSGPNTAIIISITATMGLVEGEFGQLPVPREVGPWHTPNCCEVTVTSASGHELVLAKVPVLVNEVIHVLDPPVLVLVQVLVPEVQVDVPPVE